MRKRLLSILLSVFVALSAWGQQYYKVYPVHYSDSVTEQFKQGFFYNLPQNYFVVKVTLQKNSKYVGPFADYAEKLLGLSGAIRKNETSYAIRNIDVLLQAQNDTSRTYWVEYPAKTDAPLNPNLIRIPQPETQCQWQFDFPVYNEQTKARFEMYDNYTLIEKIDTTYEAKEIDSNVVIVPKYHKKMVEKTTAQKAEEAMAKIKNIREAQWLLLTGDYNMDFSNLPYMIDELKKEEETYLSLFSGFSLTEAETCYFVITLPADKRELLMLPLFDFSPQTGVAKKIADGEVESYALQLVNRHYTDIKASVVKKQISKKQQGSFYYRIPEYYAATLLKGNQSIRNLGDIPISQYGLENQLPKNVIGLELDALTGEARDLLFAK